MKICIYSLTMIHMRNTTTVLPIEGKVMLHDGVSGKQTQRRIACRRFIRTWSWHQHLCRKESPIQAAGEESCKCRHHPGLCGALGQHRSCMALHRGLKRRKGAELPTPTSASRWTLASPRKGGVTLNRLWGTGGHRCELSANHTCQLQFWSGASRQHTPVSTM